MKYPIQMVVDMMNEPKRKYKRSFGKSFENAYVGVSDHLLLKELTQTEILNTNEKNKVLLEATKDIAERKKLEDKLAQSEKLAGIGTMASGIAHGINNPLAGIMGYAEIMKDVKNVNIMKKYAEKIIYEAEKAADMVQWLSRYSKQAKDNNIKDVDLNEVIDESLKVLNHNSRSCEIEIERNYRRIPNIKGNPNELQQIFVNLIDNAIEAMHNGGKLSLSAKMTEGYVEAKVTDSGIGIPEANLSRVFQPFFTTKETKSSTGLGLYVTSMIVKKHDGKIDVDSKVGKGTTITLKFPILNERT